MVPHFGQQNLSNKASEPIFPTLFADINIHPLLEVAGDVEPTPADLGTRFCTALATITHGRAHLHLMNRAALQEMVAFPLTVPVTYWMHRYGVLCIAPDAEHPALPALPLLTATTLAALCGSLWHGIEQRYILQSLMRHVPDAPLAHFTPTEQYIASLLARGLGENEIAHMLSRSIKTVAKHCEHMRQKLGVHSHVDVILSVHANHLVSLLDQPSPPLRRTKPRKPR